MAALEANSDGIHAAGARVLVVSFGSLQGATSWLQDTSCSLDMFLDPDRSLYCGFGLRRSVTKVWSLPTVHYYAGQVATGRALVPLHEEDDPLQMGGDFTVTREGRLIMAHPSSNPRDRPALSAIMAAISSKP